MKWYYVFADLRSYPINWDRFQQADVIYTFAAAVRHLPTRRCRGKALVVFVDKLFVGRKPYLGLMEMLDRTAADVYLSIPPSGFYEQEIAAAGRLAGVIHQSTIEPWACEQQPAARERSFLHFARRDHRFAGLVKGTDYVMDLLDEFPHYTTGDVAVGNHLGWISRQKQLQLQRRCRLLLHPSRLDSTSRTLASAIALEQLPVLAFREAEYLHSLSFGADPREYLPRYFPVANDKEHFHRLVRQLMTEDDAYQEARSRLREYRRQHPLYWEVSANYQAFAKHGLRLPSDLGPLCHSPLPSTELLRQIPDGPWTENPRALNFT